MKQVSIPLNADVAMAYIKAKPEVRKKAEFLVNLWLKDIFRSRKTSVKNLFETMEMASKIAQSNGLTPEILQDIFQDIKNEKK